MLIAATVRVARSLGMGTVAEGIETAGQAAVLERLQCDKGQGYLFARPLVADEVQRWMAARPHAGVAAQDAVHPASDVAVEQLLEGLLRSNLAIALFDPQERLVFANRSFVDLHCDGASDDIDGWLTDARRRQRQLPRRVSDAEMCDDRSVRITDETQPDGWRLVVSTEVTSLKSGGGALPRAHSGASAHRR